MSKYVNGDYFYFVSPEYHKIPIDEYHTQLITEHLQVKLKYRDYGLEVSVVCSIVQFYTSFIALNYAIKYIYSI